MKPGAPRDRLQRRYDELWSQTIGSIRAGTVELDPILKARLPDRRRGLTLISQPSPNVRQRVSGFLKELRQLEPEQYYYRDAEFHVTVLSLFTATVDYEPFFAQAEHYVSAVDAALAKATPIRVAFTGVTASPNAVMIQGFVEDDSLNDLRDALRTQLRNRGLTGSVDSRYRLETAHMTVMRFRDRLRDSERFAARLEQARQRKFGSSCIRSLRLVKNDWYMTRRVLETVSRYRLA